MTTLFAALLAAVVELQADPAHTTITFTAKHMMITTVRGAFSKVASTLKWDKDDPTKSSVDFKADVSSIDTHNDKRDAHLKSADFFDAEKCPEITFKSTRIEKAGGDKYKVSGNLTMHCVTKPATFDVTFNPNGVKSPWGTTVYAASAVGKVKRSDWGLTWNKTLESGGMLVSDDIGIDAEIEYVQNPPAAKKEAQAETKK
jgi:polyisoprenoid-binding protein YceI